jgi:hypothetical protein
MIEQSKIVGWNLVATWNDGEKMIVDVPSHIVRDVEYLLDCIEHEENRGDDDE